MADLEKHNAQLQGTIKALFQNMNTNILRLAEGQGRVENQFMAALRFSSVPQRRFLEAWNKYCLSLWGSKGNGAPVPLSEEDIKEMFQPLPSYEDASQHLGLWWDLRARFPDGDEGFKEHMKAFVEGTLDQSQLPPMPPEVSEDPAPQVDPEMAKELEEYGATEIFGGDEYDKYVERLRGEEEEAEAPVEAPELEPRRLQDDEVSGASPSAGTTASSDAEPPQAGQQP